MGEVMETLTEHRLSVAAPVVFIIVVAFQFLSWWLEQLKKVGIIPWLILSTRVSKFVCRLFNM